MIKTEVYLFAWKAILLVAQFLPGTLLCYGIFRQERKYSSYLLFPILLLTMALGSLGICQHWADMRFFFCCYAFCSWYLSPCVHRMSCFCF